MAHLSKSGWPGPRRRAFVAAVSLLLVLAACSGTSSQSDPEPSEDTSESAVDAAAGATDCPGSGAPSGAGSSSSDITDLLSSALGDAASGAASAAGGQLMGWALSALGVGGDNSNAVLNQFGQELEQINETLDDICNELSVISTELEALTCANDADWLSTPASQIDNYYNQYANWTYNTTQNSPPTTDDIEPWVEDVLDPKDGVFAQINQLNDLGAVSTSSGSIFDCIKSQTSSDGPPAAGTLDDRPYYAAVVAPIQQWFYGYYTKAYIALAEAYHFQAWQAAGSPKNTSNIQNGLDEVCPAGPSSSASSSKSPTASSSQSPTASSSKSPTASPTRSQDCQQPSTIYDEQIIPWITAAYDIGGAPYSTDKYVMANGYPDTDLPFLVATSLEDYTKAAGGSCGSKPLESDSLCGPLVGVPSYEIPSIRYDAYGNGAGKGTAGGSNGTWVSATPPHFAQMMLGYSKASSSSPGNGAGWLCTHDATVKIDQNTAPVGCTSKAYGGTAAGLENANKLIIFHEKSTTTFGWGSTDDTPVACFFDGTITRPRAGEPFCDTSKGFASVTNLVDKQDMNSEGKKVCSGTGGAQHWASAAGWTSNFSSVSLPSYYQGNVCQVGGSPQASLDFKPPPPYAQPTQPKSYHWPVLDWSELSCTASSSGASASPTASPTSAKDAMNPGGVPTMCGDDYQRWLQEQLPGLE